MKVKFTAILVLIGLFISRAQTGNVGINTVSPTNTLDVNGTLRVRKITEIGFVNAAKDSITSLWEPKSITGWDILGNSGMSATNNFLGTTDAVDLVFRINNVEKARLFSLSNPSLGLGRSTLTGVNGGASSYSGPTLFIGAAGNTSSSSGIDFIIDDDNNSTNSLKQMVTAQQELWN